ncbi:MAG: translocation/assembly module TamB domain-containing protein [Bdellovibrionales bacterium]
MKQFYLYFCTAMLSMLLGFTYRFHLPQIQTWLLNSIQIYSYEKLPTQLIIQELELSLIPLAVKLKNVQVRPNKKLAKTMTPFEIENIEAFVSWKSALLGEFRFADIIIDNAELAIILEAPEETTGPSKAFKLPQVTEKDLQAYLDMIPVNQMEISNLTYNARYLGPKISHRIEDIKINISRSNKNLLISIKTPKFLIKEMEEARSITSFPFEASALIDSKTIEIKSIKLYKDELNYIDLRGVFRNYLDRSQWQSEANLKLRFNLPEVRKIVTRFRPSLEIPNLNGYIDTEINIPSINEKKAVVYLGLNRVSIENYKIGDLKTNFNVTPELIDIKNFSLKRLKNDISLESGQLKFSGLGTDDAKLATDFELKVNSLELNQLLNDIDVGDTPLVLDIKTDENLKCSADILPSLEMSCSGKAILPYFRVFVEDNDFTINSFRNARVDGKFKLDNKGIYPEGDLYLGEKSKGYAKANIEFAKGFDINYRADHLDLNDIEDLASLNLKGTAKLKGNTRGNSSKATIDMDISAKDFSIGSYSLANVNSKIKYRKGSLYLSDFKSRYKSSQLNADLAIDLLKTRIRGTASSKEYNLYAIKDLLKDVVEIPFELKGKSNVEINFSGPLAFNKMNYDARIKSPSINVLGESFDQMEVEIVTKKGLLQTRKLELKKGEQRVFGSLSMDPSYKLKGNIQSKELEIQDFQNSQLLANNLAGKINYIGELRGLISNPKLINRLDFYDLKLGGVPINRTKATYSLERSKWQVSGNTISKSLNFDVILPQVQNEEFQMKLLAENYNFAPIFALIGLDIENLGFSTGLTANIDLKAAKGGFWQSTGNLDIKNLRIQRANLSMESKNPLMIRFNKGKFESNVWSLEGSDTSLKAQFNPSRENNIQSSLNGKINLALVSFMLPFLEDIQGNLSIAAELKGSIYQPDLTGSAFATNTFIKVPNFPHTFENARADLLFSKNKLIINKYSASLAGGSLLGSGNVEFSGLKNVPVYLTGKMTNSRLQPVDGVSAVSDGNLVFSGSWFPYTISGSVNASNGSVSAPEGNSELSIRPSKYLPNVLLEESFDPVALNLLVKLEPSMKIESPEIRGNMEGRLRLSGPLSKLVYDGTINLTQNSKLFFKDKPFDITTANIKFENDSDLNPLLYLQANSSLLEETSNTNYDVELLIQGPFNAFSTELSSQPVLPERDILSLLALGVRANETEGQALGEAEEIPAYEIGSAVFNQTPLGKELKERTGITLKFSSDVDETNSSSPSVVLSKQLTPRINGSTSQGEFKKTYTFEYKLNEESSAILSYEQEQTETTGTETTENDVWGLDFLYKIEFE